MKLRPPGYPANRQVMAQYCCSNITLALMIMDHCYVKFEIADENRLLGLERVVEALVEEVASEAKHSDEEWKTFFDQSALNTFWWPSQEERKEWEKVWFGTPYQERHKIPPTRWDFGSLIETLVTNEWTIIGVRKLDSNVALIEFDPQAYPFGGTNCLVALIEAFGHRVLERNDGTGVEAYQPVKEYWQPSNSKRRWWALWG